MTTQEVVKKVLDVVAPQIEVAVKALIEAESDKVVDAVLAKIAEAIPGKIDDIIIAQVAAKVKEELKAAALVQADKISDKV